MALMATLAVGAQTTPRSIFTTAPSELLPTIDRSTRVDMLDYAESGIKRYWKDVFGEDVIISAIDENHLTVEYSGGHTLDFYILPAGKSEDILMIKRVVTPAIDSEIGVFNTRWEQLGKAFREPTLDEWLIKSARDKRADIENALSFIMVNASYDPTTLTLTLTPDFAGYIAREDKALIESSIHPSITYKWDGKKFNLNKQK